MNPNVDIPVLFWHVQTVVLIFLYNEGNIKLRFTVHIFNDWAIISCYVFHVFRIFKIRLILERHFGTNIISVHSTMIMHIIMHIRFCSVDVQLKRLYKRAAQTPVQQTPVQTCSSNACTNRCPSEEENRFPGKMSPNHMLTSPPLLTQADNCLTVKAKSSFDVFERL